MPRINCRPTSRPTVFMAVSVKCSIGVLYLLLVVPKMVFLTDCSCFILSFSARSNSRCCLIRSFSSRVCCSLSSFARSFSSFICRLGLSSSSLSPSLSFFSFCRGAAGSRGKAPEQTGWKLTWCKRYHDPRRRGCRTGSGC